MIVLEIIIEIEEIENGHVAQIHHILGFANNTATLADVAIGFHLTDDAALDAGCRRFDSIRPMIEPL